MTYAHLITKREGAVEHRRVPEGAGPHPGGQAELRELRDDDLPAEGDGQVAPTVPGHNAR